MPRSFAHLSFHGNVSLIFDLSFHCNVSMTLFPCLTFSIAPFLAHFPSPLSFHLPLRANRSLFNPSLHAQVFYIFPSMLIAHLPTGDPGCRCLGPPASGSGPGRVQQEQCLWSGARPPRKCAHFYLPPETCVQYDYA